MVAAQTLPAPRQAVNEGMKLTDLQPSWRTLSAGREGMGVRFRCPCQRCKLMGDPVWLLVWFANPIDGGPAARADFEPFPRWTRTGDTFDTLSVVPSVDFSKPREPDDGTIKVPGHWHGHITNGEVA